MTRAAHVRWAGAWLFACAACDGPTAEEGFTITPPSWETFPAVGHVVAAHCGTLDCHGDAARNVRVYSIYGLRLDPNDVTGFGGTTDDELRRTYESIIAIEPEKLSRIVREGGAGAGDWIVLGKGRGVQHHEGGRRLIVGEAADTCIVLWLAGRSDAGFEEVCQQGAVILPPSEEW